MPVTISLVFNTFPDIAAALPAAMDAIAESAAETLRSTAVETAPVSDRSDAERDGLPHMRDTIKTEKIDDHWEVSVQKDQAMAGEKTWAWFNNDGTVHYAGSHWFTDSCVTAGEELHAIALEALLGI